MNENLYRILSPEKLDMFRRAFSDLQVCIVDEISMVGADKIYDMSRRICEIIISEELFGNIAILFVGDLMQVRTISFNVSGVIRVAIFFAQTIRKPIKVKH